MFTLWWLLAFGRWDPAPPAQEASAARRGFADEVTVTAALREQPVAETPAAVAVLTSEALAATAASTVDDALRQAPGFSLFRRSGSRTANPTTQGAALRGLGGSGASRAAVLDDGLPLNDAFGGWVQWSRVPLQALERIEVLRGGASDLYGTGALGGVVQLVRRSRPEQRLDVDASAGSMDTRALSVFGSGAWRGWNARLVADVFRTGGYVPVRAAERGPVDAPVASRHRSADLTLERSPRADARAFLRASVFGEERDNGTPLQTNDTRLWQLAGGVDRGLLGGALVARAHLGHQRYRQDFSAIGAGRASEQLTRTQEVPADWGGAAAHWTRALGAHVLLAGGEVREVRGRSDEEAVTATARTPSSSGGRQRTAAVFVEDTWAVAPGWRVTAGARADGWRNFHAQQSSGMGTRSLPERSETAVSPRLAVRRQAAPWLSLTASGYGAFRAPTLNELYRSFRVGNVVTQADPTLRAERLRGAEAGALAMAGRLSARLTAFWMDVDDTIANVTLSQTPALVTRQRRNLGRIRSRGLELEAEVRLARALVMSGSWVLTDAGVLSFPEELSLQGKRLAQIPRHQLALQARYEGRRLRVSAQGRWTSSQYEDDLNTLALAPLGNVDLRAAYAPSRRLEAFVALENALDSDQEVGRTPVVTLGAPRAVRAGLRFSLGGAPGTSVAQR
jgi:outer membrane receptor protein involved in Fe transport